VDLLTAPVELAIIKKILAFPEIVESCAWTYEPHRLAEFLHDVAGLFHGYYHEYRVVTEDVPLTSARLLLCRAVQIVLRNGFAILGIGAPEKM
jgi:arginyl-tRNA synthetase